MESASSVDTVTVLFTDIEGSTSLWVQHPHEAGEALAQHDEILAGAVEGTGGTVVKSTGDGVMAVFRSIRAGVDAAVAAQFELQGHESVLLNAGRVRMGLHVGTVEERFGDYFGLAINECQRLMSAGHAGQILLSEVAATLLRKDLPLGCSLSDLGMHRLRGIPEPERIFQLVHPRLPSEFPPLGKPESPAAHLPEQLTSFVGRETELAEVGELLTTHRLVTLTGPGGAGKTRLASEVALRNQDRFPDGMWMVELAALADPALVPRHAAAALGIGEEPTRGDVESVIGLLADRTSLLIMDNCEHLTAAAATLTDVLLRALPELRVLATSRERLRVPGETGYPVPPLDLPPADADPEEAAGYDSVRLFIDRAALVKPGFGITPVNRPALVQIARHLDGIPLAIELAAAQVSVMSPDQIADHLDDRLGLLTTGARSALPRQQTLRGAIDWSYDRLGEEEQKLFGRLAVFNDGFDIDGAVSVCGDGGSNTFSLLMELVEKSMVARDSEEDRYHLLETMRQYAAEILAGAGETAPYSDRHARYFAGLLDVARGEIFGSQQSGWLDRLSQERHNLLAAMAWALESRQSRLLLEMVSSAWPFWLLQGWLSEGREWLERALEVSEGDDQPRRAVALLGAGGLAANQGDVTAAEELLQAARAEAGPEDLRTAASATAQLAGIAHKRGDLAGATSLFRQALSLSRTSGDDWTTGHVLASLSLLLEDQGYQEEAQTLAAEGVALARATGNPDLIADTLLTAGEIAINRHDQVEAQAYLEEALALADENGLEIVDAWAHVYLGKLACHKGDIRAGRVFLQEGMELFEDLSYPMGTAWALRHLARAEFSSGDHTAAKTYLVSALQLAQEYVRPEVPLALEALGELHVGLGDYEVAATLLSAARSLSETLGVTIPEADRLSLESSWGEVKSHLGDERRATLAASAAAMTLDEAVAYAAEQGSPG